MLTPIDIENKVFKKVKVKGYDIQDVEDFMEQIINDYESLYKENSELRDKVNLMQDSVSYYKSVEEGINKTIENAQHTAEDIRENAKQEALNIKREAEIEVKDELINLRKEITNVEVELEEKKKQMQIYRVKVKSMLEAQLKILDEQDIDY